MVNLIALWREHGLDEVMREAHARGTVLCGYSAGSMCWFEWGVSRGVGTPVANPGLGLLAGSHCVHYGDEPGRKEAYYTHLKRGMCPGYAAADGAALHFRGPRMVEAVSSRMSAGAWCVGDGGEEIVETALPVRYLGEPPAGEDTDLSAVA